jgi:hypothetical protein
MVATSSRRSISSYVGSLRPPSRRLVIYIRFHTWLRRRVGGALVHTWGTCDHPGGVWLYIRFRLSRDHPYTLSPHPYLHPLYPSIPTLPTHTYTHPWNPPIHPTLPLRETCNDEGCSSFITKQTSCQSNYITIITEKLLT